MTTAEHPPTARPALGRLRLARARFLAGHPPPADVPDEVAAAWRRARFHGVRPDTATPAAGRAPQSPEPELLAAARPVLERLTPVLDHERATLLLTDARLRVLWSAGHAPWDTLCRDFAEESVGPNSAALALRTGHRAEVHGPEHILDVWQEVSAVSVPLRTPGDARPVGTVTVASALGGGCAPHPQAALAEATAAAVEAELRAHLRPPERAVLDAYLAACARQERPVVAFAGHSRLVSEAAARLLSARDIEDLERAVHEVPRRDAPGTPLPGGAAVEIVRHLGETAGAVAVLEPAPG
ncbi:regulator, partial [Streptomyces sp900105755]